MTNQKEEQTPLESEILREVAEEMQEEQLKRLWKKISPFVTGAVILILAVTGALELYKNYQTRRSLEESERLETALKLIEADDAATGAEMLKTLAETSARGYRYIAAFHYADYLMGQGQEKYEEAVHVLDGIINDARAPKPLKNLALFDKILLRNENGSLDVEQTEEELEKLAAENKVWAPLALEFLAELALQQGDTETAKDRWKEVLEKKNISESVRSKIAGYISFVDGNAKTGK